MPDRARSHILEFGNNINVSSPTRLRHGQRIHAGMRSRRFGIRRYPIRPFRSPKSTASFDAGRAHYNSLQIKAETKSARHGIYALVGYTYSRAYDTGFSDGLGSIIGATYFPLPNWQNLDWGLSQINLNQNFTASVIYSCRSAKGRNGAATGAALANALAGGWELTVIEKATSGFPVFVVDSNNTSGAGFAEHECAKPDPSESDLQSGAEQPDARRVVQPGLLRAAGVRASSETPTARRSRARIS